MKKLYLLLAGLLVLNATSSMLNAQGGEEEPRKHEHWPPRGRLRQKIHEARTGKKEENRSRRSLLGRCKSGPCKDEERRRREERRRHRHDRQNVTTRE